MFMAMEPVLVPGVDPGLDSDCAAVEFDSVHTLAPSFHRMPALPQSARVSGWLEVSAANMFEESACAAVDFDSVVGVAASKPVFGVAGLELVGPPVGSDWAWAPAVPVLRVSESEPVCALAGKASITAKRGTVTRPRKCIGKANRRMS
jgi:hypothetical protein